MIIRDKYKSLEILAGALKVEELTFREANGVLHIDGKAPSEAVRAQLATAHNNIDPEGRSGDLILNIQVDAMQPGASARVVTKSSNLNLRAEPSTDGKVVGKAAHHEVVTLVSKHDDKWWSVKTKDGETGFAYAEYLQPVTDSAKS